MRFAFGFTVMLIIALSMCTGMLVFGLANGFSIYNNPWVDWGMVAVNAILIGANTRTLCRITGI